MTYTTSTHITCLQARNTELVEENRRLKAALAGAPASPFEAANSRVAEYHQLKEAYTALEAGRDALAAKLTAAIEALWKAFGVMTSRQASKEEEADVIVAVRDFLLTDHPGVNANLPSFANCESDRRTPDPLPDIPGLPLLLAEYRKALAKHPTFAAQTDGMGCTLAEEVLEVCTAGMKLLQAINDHRDEGLPLDDVRREFAHVWVVAGRAVGRLAA